MKLFYSPGACSMAVHIALNWVNAEFELEKPDIQSDAYASINPMRQIPILILDDGTALSQCNAILRFIADKYPEAAIGGEQDAVSQYEINRWLSFVATDLHRSHAPYFFQPRFIIDGDEDEHVRIKQAAENHIGTLLTRCDEWLSGRDYCAGDAVSIADAYAFTVFRWSRKMARPAYDYPNIRLYMDRVKQNPGVALAMQREGVE